MKLVPYSEAKVYSDGSHYIAIPHTKRHSMSRINSVEEVITILEERDKVSSKEIINDQVKETNKQEKDIVVRRMTKRERFNELYLRYINEKPAVMKEKIIKEMRGLFPSLEKTVSFVEENIARKKRNLISKRIRLWRKANLQEFNYFVTFTYDENKHSEESFKKKLRRCLWNLGYRKGWKYIGVWERSLEKQRLHFHGIFNIPGSSMPGIMLELEDYSFSSKRIEKRTENLYFTERFGRNDFKQLSVGVKDETIGYILKYIEKSGERIVYSKGLPQYFISDINEDDVVSRIGIDERKLLLYDNFNCIDKGKYIGKVSKDVIARMRKSN